MRECIIAFFAIMFVIVTYLYVKLRSQIKDITEQIEFIENVTDRDWRAERP